MKNFSWLGCLWILLAMPVAAATSRIYIADSGGNDISIVDPATNEVVDTIPGIAVVKAVCASPDGNRLYIAAGSEDVLFVLDRKTKKLIKKVPLSGSYSDDVMATSDGKLVVVTYADDVSGGGGLDIIDAASLKKIKSIPTEGRLHDMDLTADGKYAIAGSPKNFLAFFDLQKQEFAGMMNFDEGILPVVIQNGPEGGGLRIFLQLSRTNGFAVVDFAKRQEVARVHLPDEPTGYLGTGSASHGLGLTPDGKTVWVASTVANSVFVYSLPNLVLEGRVPLPELKVWERTPVASVPQWIVFTPDSKTAYVSNHALHTVTAIDTKTMKVIKNIQVGECPTRMSTVVFPESADVSTAPEDSGSPGKLDYEFFKAHVEPIFLKNRSPIHSRCFNCHEETKHRRGYPYGLNLKSLSPGHNFWTEGQSRLNFETVSKLVVPGNVSRSRFPMHPLAPEAGGDIPAHNGGRQFESQDDPDFLMIARWIRGARSSSVPVQSHAAVIQDDTKHAD